MIKCQCPYSGFLHFYQDCGCNATVCVRCVNALIRAFFISTEEKTMTEEETMVSMPLFGLSSFLRTKHGLRIRERLSVNALIRAFFISTKSIPEPGQIQHTRVNALIRAFFISTLLKGPIMLQHLNRVNALIRAFFISTDDGYLIDKTGGFVSMPLFGLSSFLLMNFTT